MNTAAAAMGLMPVRQRRPSNDYPPTTNY